MALLSSFSFNWANVPESKTTVELIGDKALIDAGPTGVQLVCTDDGALKGSLDRPNPASLGLDSSVVTVNAAAFSGKLVFMADRWNPRDLADSRYIWLPLEFQEGKPLLRYCEEWDFSFFEYKTSNEIIELAI